MLTTFSIVDNMIFHAARYYYAQCMEIYHCILFRVKIRQISQIHPTKKL